MLQYTPIERTVFEAIFLFGPVNFTKICEIARLIRHEKTPLPETKRATHWAVDRLLGENLISEDSHGGSAYYFLSREQEKWETLKTLSDTPEFRETVERCDEILDRMDHYMFGNLFIAVLERTYTAACAVFILHNRLSDAEALTKRYEEREKHWYYGDRRGGPFHALTAGFQYLFSFPEYREQAGTLPDFLILKVLPEYLLLSIIYGTKFPDWKQLYDRTIQPLQKRNLAAFILAAFWSNDRKMIEELSASYEVQPLGEACLAALAGEWKTADQKFTRYINTMEITGNPGDPLITLLITTAIFPACISQAAATRMHKYLEYVFENRSIPRTIDFRFSFSDLAGAFRTNCFLSGKDVNPELPLSCLLAFPLYCLSPKLKAHPDVVRKGLKVGKMLMERNHITAGIWLLNEAGTLLPPEDPERSSIAGLAERYQVTPFLPMTTPKKEWENVLDALEKLFPVPAGKQDEKSPRAGKVVWVINKVEYNQNNRTKLYVFEGIHILFLPVSKRGGFGTAKNISLQSFLKGTVDAYLTPEECTLKTCIERSYSGAPSEFTKNALDILQKSENVCLEDTNHPVKLIREENAIQSRVTPGGWVKLSLKHNPDTVFYNKNQVFLDLSEEGVCRYCNVVLDNPVFRFFNTYGRNGVISIPQEGTKGVAETLARISKRIPVTGELASAAYRDLPRKEGVAEIHAFLIREGALFTAEFRCHPCPDADWFVKPGCGIEQRLMGAGAKQYFLIRDLEKERKVFYTMLEKCPSIPVSAKQEFVCDSDDPEQILMYLSDLKESGFVLDWNAEKPWKVSGMLDTSRLRLTGGSGINWFAVSGELRVDDKTVLTLQQLFEALDRKTGNFIRLDDATYLRLTRDLMKKLELLRASGTVKKEKLEVSPAALPMLSSAFSSDLPEKLLEQMENVRQAFAKKITLPKGLRGELRPYQADGYQYLARMADCRIGCCLADDMGLGKTIQLLTLLLREAHRGPALVVCPASLCRNWEREAQKFAPSLHTILLPQSDREQVIKKAGKGDLVLCSYGIVQSESELFSGKAWHTVILDEAQAIKNYAAKRSKSAKTLQADIRIASTGTPVENNLLELWSIFDFLNPGLLGDASGFEAKFCENDHPRPVLKKLVSPLIIRRRKQEVLEDLPPKTEITLTLELPEQERAMYEALRRRALEELQGNEESHIAILAQLTKLRRFCCDPSLVAPGTETGAKVRKLMELVQELKTAGHRALVFSQYVDFLSILRREMEKEEITFQYLDGSTLPAQRMKAVDEFQNGNGDCFLISLKAGGTGLNLTAANYVILADPWWNPAVEDQAADRVHRIGQTDPVTVYRLIAEDTVEERVLELHSRKKQVSDDILSDARSSGITAKELMSLFQESKG